MNAPRAGAVRKSPLNFHIALAAGFAATNSSARFWTKATAPALQQKGGIHFSWDSVGLMGIVWGVHRDAQVLSGVHVSCVYEERVHPRRQWTCLPLGVSPHWPMPDGPICRGVGRWQFSSYVLEPCSSEEALRRQAYRHRAQP